MFFIIFKENKVLPHHNDHLVITGKITHCEVHIILVDNGSFSNIVEYATLAIKYNGMI